MLAPGKRDAIEKKSPLEALEAGKHTLWFQDNLIHAYRETRSTRNIKLGCGSKTKWKAKAAILVRNMRHTHCFLVTCEDVCATSDFMLFRGRTYLLA